MNHCLIQAVINTAPQMRYTKESKTAIAEMMVNFKGLRDEDPSRELKVLGWGTIAKEMVEELKEGQNIVVEGRLRMNSVTRQDGTKEKQTELTASRIHHIIPAGKITSEKEETNITNRNDSNSSEEKSDNSETSQWGSSPLVPEIDEIPF